MKLIVKEKFFVDVIVVFLGVKILIRWLNNIFIRDFLVLYKFFDLIVNSFKLWEYKIMSIVILL